MVILTPVQADDLFAYIEGHENDVEDCGEDCGVRALVIGLRAAGYVVEQHDDGSGAFYSRRA